MVKQPKKNSSKTISSLQSRWVGRTFGLLTVIEALPHRKARCKCVCGNTATVLRNNLVRSNTTSCGCTWREAAAKAITRHGMVGTPTYSTWSNMKTRCSNPNSDRYKFYGARGIKVCRRWLNFENFYADMGARPEGKTLDRIDNGRGYCKSNCRWATPKEQCRNRRDRRSA